MLLNEAIADLVNTHARLDISQAWGDGSAVAADGTHMDTYLDNLLAETSVRYGKPGGITYHHISDTYEHSPFSPPGRGCTASFLLCTACPNARVTPAHHPRLAHLHQALGNLRGVLEPAVWEADWADAHARLDDLRDRLGQPVWEAALAAVGDTDRLVIDHLLHGDYDL
ncbi:Tn3 family transposase [Streptomyces sp. NPDC000851]